MVRHLEKQVKLFAFPAAVLAAATMVSAARADEKKLPLKDLPANVVESVKKRFPKAELLEAAKEVEDGKTEYEVTIRDDGAKIDVTLNSGGAITTLEKTIPAAKLPEAVRTALEAKYPGAKYTTVEEVVKVADGKEAVDFYEVLLTTKEDKKLEVALKANGEIKKTEDKKNEEKKNEKD